MSESLQQAVNTGDLAAAMTNEFPGGGEMDMVLDVELPITVSIGSAQLPLRDVVKLTTGSIVELDRLVSDPVDILVNNRVIARGEVVIIEGNYGVRILQVVSRSERLALRGKPSAGRQDFKQKPGS
jgi:flagellar motor switch protein FliN